MPAVTVKGMACNHCRQAVAEALQTIPGVTDVTVDLATGEAAWKETEPVDPAEIRKAIVKLGFEVQ